MSARRAFSLPSLAFSFAALAAVATSARPSQAQEVASDATVELPENRIQATLPPTSHSAAEPLPRKLDFSLSTYVPHHFGPASRLADDPNFRANGMPMLELSYYTSLRDFTGSEAFFAKAGFQYLNLKREGTISEGGIALTTSQTVSLPGLNLAIQYAPMRFFSDTLLPYAELGVNPTFAITELSAFDDGTTYFGAPFQATLGSEVRLTQGAGLMYPGLNVGVQGIAGKIHGASVSGLGVVGGLRWAI